MQNPKTRINVLAVLRKDLQKELKTMSSKKVNSCLRQRSFSSLKNFSWAQLVSEVETNAPTLHQVLQGLVTVRRQERSRKKEKQKKRSYHAKDSTIFGLCVAVLLRHHNHSMSLVQRIISLVLHSGHAGKQVGLVLYFYIYMCDYARKLYT